MPTTQPRDVAPTVFRQSTLEEIIDSERLMLVTAEQRYGKYHRHARDCTFYMSRFITGVNPDRMIFARLFSQMKKHHTLALFSILRLHKVQAMMNLRQALEAGASAAFAIANPERHHFVETDERGILDPSQPLSKKRYGWLDKHYPQGSQRIKEVKGLINSFSAHANVVTADIVFRINDAGDGVDTPFFDIEDEYHVKGDLWLISSVAITLMDLMYGVNQSSNAIKFPSDFHHMIEQMLADNRALLADIKETERYKLALDKYEPSQAK
jgi:hypothetical protein